MQLVSRNGAARRRPRFVNAGEEYTFSGVQHPHGIYKAKVRAEVARKADCSGGTGRDLSVENKNMGGEQQGVWQATLRGTPESPVLKPY